jgi:protein TonB
MGESLVSALKRERAVESRGVQAPVHRVVGWSLGLHAAALAALLMLHRDLPPDHDTRAVELVMLPPAVERGATPSTAGSQASDTPAEQPPDPTSELAQDQPPAPPPQAAQDQPPVPQPQTAQDQPPVPQPQTTHDQPPVPQPQTAQDQPPVTQPRIAQDQPPVPPQTEPMQQAQAAPPDPTLRDQQTDPTSQATPSPAAAIPEPPPPPPPPPSRPLRQPRPPARVAAQSRPPLSHAGVADAPSMTPPSEGIQAVSPGSAPPAASTEQVSRAGADPAWLAGVGAWLMAHRSYPEMARALGRQGTVVVQITVNADGQVVGVNLLRGSGSDSLDHAAETLMQNARLPPFPPNMKLPRQSVTIPIRYRLE